MTASMNAEWSDVCAVDDVPVLGARVVRRPAAADIALFRNADDRVFALLDRCPHKGGPLSQGIVFGERVACPLHNWTIELDSGCAVAPDQGCARRFAVKIGDGRVHLETAVLNATATDERRPLSESGDGNADARVSVGAAA